MRLDFGLFNGVRTVRLQGIVWAECHVALQDGHDPIGARGGMFSSECEISTTGPCVGAASQQIGSYRTFEKYDYLKEVGH